MQAPQVSSFAIISRGNLPYIPMCGIDGLPMPDPRDARIAELEQQVAEQQEAINLTIQHMYHWQGSMNRISKFGNQLKNFSQKSKVVPNMDQVMEESGEKMTEFAAARSKEFENSIHRLKNTLGGSRKKHYRIRPHLMPMQPMEIPPSQFLLPSIQLGPNGEITMPPLQQ